MSDVMMPVMMLVVMLMGRLRERRVRHQQAHARRYNQCQR
jgi:hypothetical protein